MTMLWAYLSLFAGCAILLTLGDAKIAGARAWSIVALAVGLCWGYFVLSMIAWLNASTRNIEAQNMKKFSAMFDDKPEPPGIQRNLLQVDTAQWVIEDTLSAADLRALAIGLLAGRPFSERAWPGLPNFRQVQDQFERRGLVKVRGKKRELNGRGTLAMLQVKYHGAVSLPSPIQAD